MSLKPPTLAALLLVSCASPSPGVDSGTPLPGGDAGAPDAGAPDAGAPDAGAPDAGPAAPYTLTLFDAARITSDGSKPNFHKVRAPVPLLTGGPFARVTLKVDLASTCYPFTKWATNAPPAGQRWPADCDAFDRNFEWVLRRVGADAGTPGVELLRAITPFGGPLRTEVDVTEIFNALEGAQELEVNIPTYSDGAGQVSGSNGGWNVSGALEVVPGPAPSRVLAVIPLVDTIALNGSEAKEVAFTLPPGTTSTRLEYRVTGHGGAQPAAGSPCIGPAEEFCTRTHVLSADGAELVTFQAWRTDCTALCTLASFAFPGSGAFQYCQENPCGSIASVRAPRANWCPGSVTPPELYAPTQWRSPGPHTFKYAIDTIASGGQWRVSAVVIAYGD